MSALVKQKEFVMNVLFKLGILAIAMQLGLQTALAVEPGFTPLFDGQSIDGWIGGTDSFDIADGQLVSRPGSRGNLLTKDEYDDFELRFEFRLTPGANNGLGIRVPREGNGSYEGIELQILDDTADKYRDLKPYQYHGSAYGIAPARRGFLKPVGEWNEQEVHCEGRKITVILNGTKILDADLDEAAPGGKTLDGVPHPGLANSSGHVGFLCHDDVVAFRNIRIKPLHSTSAPKP